MDRCLLMIALIGVLGAEDLAVAGSAGERAFADLGAHYLKQRLLEPEVVVGALAEGGPTAVEAGDYLRALLIQSLADERNGRVEWQALPFWGGGWDSEARTIRGRLIEAVAERGTGAACLPALEWILAEERNAELVGKAVGLLRTSAGPEAEACILRLLGQGHPMGAVLVAAVGCAGQRGIGRDLLPRYAAHHRSAVREAASKACAELGLEPAAFDPATALNAVLGRDLPRWFDRLGVELTVETPWVSIRHLPSPAEGQTPTAPSPPTYGWLLPGPEPGSMVLDHFGRIRQMDEGKFAVSPVTLAEAAESYVTARGAGRDGLGALSPRGGLTSQFEAEGLHVPEALVASWAWRTGDRELAARLLLPRLDELADDRWADDIVRDALGQVQHQQMLAAFCFNADDRLAGRLATLLASDLFAGYQYQERARELLEELPLRTADRAAGALPTPEAWADLRPTLDRAATIAYLRERLCQLRCRQQGQPGGVTYQEGQTALPPLDPEPPRWFPWASLWGWQETKGSVINPWSELWSLDLGVDDIPALTPGLLDRRHLRTFSFWRDFHPAREFHRVDAAVVRLIHAAAHRELVDTRRLYQTDDQGRRALMAEIVAWAEVHAGESVEQLLISAITDATDRRAVEAAAESCAARGITAAVPAIVARLADFPERPANLARWCLRIDPVASVPAARVWIADADPGLVLLAQAALLAGGTPEERAAMVEPVREGFQSRTEANQRADLLAALAAAGDEGRRILASLLERDGFEPSWGNAAILQRMIVLGLDEAQVWLDHRLAGGATEREVLWLFRRWHGDPLPDDDTEARAAARAWLQAQWEIQRLGGESALSQHLDELPGGSGWRVDAP